MKKFKIYLTTMLILTALSFQANAVNVVVKTNYPEAFIIKIDGTPIDGNVMQQNDLDVPESGLLEVVPKGGYILSSVTLNGNPDETFSKYSGWKKTITSDCQGYVYEVTAKMMAEWRDASCWLTIDKISAVRIVRSVSFEEVNAYRDGEEEEVWYNSDEELPLIITSATGAPIYKVTLNGNKIEGSTSFEVSPPTQHGDILKVITQFPEEDYSVSFDFVNGDEKFFTEVIANGVKISPEDYGEFKIKAGTQLSLKGDLRAYKFNSLTVGDTQITEFTGEYSTYITQDTKIQVDVEKLDFDSQMILYLNVEPTESDLFTFTNSAKAEFRASLQKGYNQIGFSQVQNPFSWSWSGEGMTYINGVAAESESDTFANYSDKTINSGDVIKLYIGETQENTYSVTFKGDLKLADITQDVITPVDATQSISVLPGTRITFKAAGSEQIKVWIGETELTSADGVVTYDVNEDTEFTITDLASSIPVMEDKEPSVIYNMLGIKMTSRQLPAGIYIVNGKPVLVK